MEELLPAQLRNRGLADCMIALRCLAMKQAGDECRDPE